MNAMEDKQQENQNATRLEAAQRRIIEHHGYKEKELYDGLARTMYAVFMPNRDELVALLDRAKNDPELAIELFQNMWRPNIRMQFEGAVMRALHNYVASAMALVEHTRRIMRDRSGPIVDEFERRKLAVLDHPEIQFIQNLRNYVLHRSLPFIGHEVRVQPEPGVDATSEIRLSTRELRAWDKWSAAARRLIDSNEDELALRPIVDVHAALVIDLNEWLIEALSKANSETLAEVNRLVDESNAILGGVDIDEARRITAAVTARRKQPKPTAEPPVSSRG
jgi:hypothetical protein